MPYNTKYLEKAFERAFQFEDNGPASLNLYPAHSRKEPERLIDIFFYNYVRFKYGNNFSQHSCFFSLRISENLFHNVSEPFTLRVMLKLDRFHEAAGVFLTF